MGHGALKADVGSGKGVRLAEQPQGDVMRRPFPYSGQGAKPCDGIVERTTQRKNIRIGESGGGKRHEAFRSGARQAHIAKVGLGEHVWRRKNMG